MADPLQSNLSDQERNKLIETYGKDSKFKNLFKNIFGSGTGKKVENFLREQRDFNPQTDFMQEIPGYFDPRTGKIVREDEMMAMHDYQQDPMLYKTAKEIYETPGYDPASKAEAKRQLDLMDAGLPRFPKV
tara:strand:+ start:138 stop:530 length:393 start_codon:yes stop_codon:yes gene_type:complete